MQITRFQKQLLQVMGDTFSFDKIFFFNFLVAVSGVNFSCLSESQDKTASVFKVTKAKAARNCWQQVKNVCEFRAQHTVHTGQIHRILSNY